MHSATSSHLRSNWAGEKHRSRCGLLDEYAQSGSSFHRLRSISSDKGYNYNSAWGISQTTPFNPRNHIQSIEVTRIDDTRQLLDVRRLHKKVLHSLQGPKHDQTVRVTTCQAPYLRREVIAYTGYRTCPPTSVTIMADGQTLLYNLRGGLPSSTIAASLATDASTGLTYTPEQAFRRR